MAFNLGDIIVTIKSKTDDLKKGLDDVKGLTQQAEAGTSKLGALAGGVEKFGKMAVVGLSVAGVAAAAFGGLSVKAFSESEDVMKQTEAVLKSTGGAAGVTADQVSNLASELQKTTKFSDETVQSGENLLLTFTSIGKDIFPTATQTMLDMSQALGQDTKSSAIQLGKALQDPINGVTALRRVGVNFSDAQQQVIADLVNTGKSAEAQKLILAELNKEFGGSAKAAGETFSGKLTILKNKFSDIEETVGKVIVNAIVPLADKFTKWIDSVGGAQGIVDSFVNTWKLLTTGDFSGGIFGLSEDSPIIGFLFGVRDFVIFIRDTAITVFQTLKAVWDLLYPSIAALASTIIDRLWPALLQIWNAIQPGFMEALKILGIILGVVVVAAIWLLINAINVIVSVLSFVIKIVADVIGWFGNLIGATINLVGAIIGWFSRLPGNIGNIVNSVVQWFKDLPGRIGGAVGGVVDTLTSPFKTAFNAIARLWNNSIGKLSFKAPDWVPGIGGKGFSMPTLPYLAGGTDNFRGGWAVVGERGPELAYMPAGTAVYSNQKSQGMVGNNMTINGDIYIDSKEDADYFFKKMGRNIDLSSKGLTTQPGSVGVA